MLAEEVCTELKTDQHTVCRNQILGMLVWLVADCLTLSERKAREAINHNEVLQQSSQSQLTSLHLPFPNPAEPIAKAMLSEGKDRFRLE